MFGTNDRVVQSLSRLVNVACSVLQSTHKGTIYICIYIFSCTVLKKFQAQVRSERGGGVIVSLLGLRCVSASESRGMPWL